MSTISLVTIRTSNHVLNSMLNYEHFQLVADNGLTILYVADEVLLIDCVLTFYNSLSFVPFPLSNAFIRQLFFFFYLQWSLFWKVHHRCAYNLLWNDISIALFFFPAVIFRRKVNKIRIKTGIIASFKYVNTKLSQMNRRTLSCDIYIEGCRFHSIFVIKNKDIV